MARLAMATALFVVSATSLGLAQNRLIRLDPAPDGTPRVEADFEVGTAMLTFRYGRPELKGRADTVAIPKGTEWRLGGTQPPVLVTTQAIKLGTVTLAAGTYQLSAIPSDESWQLLIRRNASGAGAEAGRVTMTLSKTPESVEQLKISVQPGAVDSRMLHIEWGTTRASAPISLG